MRRMSASGRWRRAWLFPCLGALAAGGGLAAQAEMETPGESVRTGPSVALPELSARCVELSWPEEPFALHGGRLVSETCHVARSGPLIRTESAQWRWALYRREFVYEAGSDVKPEDLRFFPDTVREAELVLFAETAGQTLRGPAGAGEARSRPRPVWHDRSDTSLEFIEPPRAAALPGETTEGALFAHRRCLNGTGGCMDHPYRLTPDGSVRPLRAAYRAQVRERLPQGWGTWKGVWLEPEGLRAEAAVYVPRDANCCPSFRAAARVAVAADSLFLDSLDLAPQPTGFGWEVVPGESFGYADAATSEEGLVEAYGAGAVEPADVYLAEGFCTPGTRVFPDHPWRIEVAWADSARTRPAFARAAGTEGPWHTPAGVRLGTTVVELAAMRGEPIRFGGFGWDYGGGARWEEEGGALRLRVGPDSASNRRLHGDLREDPRSDELFGDRTVRSDHPLARQLTIRVEEMTVDWAEPAIQRDCEDPDRAEAGRGAPVPVGR